MCGILGIYGGPQAQVSNELILGLSALQHRGQDAAGIVTFSGNFHLKKGLGMVSEVFSDEDVPRLLGHAGLGHVRYVTQGRNDVVDAQPFVVNYPFGLAMVHNGNVINYAELRQQMFNDRGRLLETSSDLELIVYTLASEIERSLQSGITVDDIFAAVTATQQRVLGAYSTMALIANKGFLAFTDPYGIRPLVLGEKEIEQGRVYALASETNCFDYLGFQYCRDLVAGEAIFIDEQGQVHSRICRSERPAFCIFEYIYFAREDSHINGRLVARERVRMGRALADTFKRTGLKPDIIIDVPASAYFFASGLAEGLEVPYRRGIAKNSLVGRSFLMPTQEERELIVRQKLNPIRDVIRGKKVAVVDDSIVRGTTSKHIVKLLRESGAAAVYFVSAAPPIKFPCIYGIDMSIKREMIAANFEEDDISRHIGAEAVIYQSLDDLRRLYAELPCCHACFSGEYPIAESHHCLTSLEQARLRAKNQLSADQPEL